MKRLLLYFFGFIILASQTSCGYNDMVAKDENVAGKWAQVQNAYQRRADLVPNLVNTVKGAANFEQKTLTDVTEARSQATRIQLKPEDLTPENIQKFQAAQAQLSGSLSRLLATVESYPQLKANQNFLELQAQLEGTENRISVERMNFNNAVQDYNTYIRSFPRNIFAGWFGFERKTPFAADPNAQRAPAVTF
ncbi:LemA family protein [Adhaeribacter radiodurans]|uniref:LemA family protein n=1 Tax=Adhaeribacter radiodurans TaxID=2745197 RepID=A0A7L7L1X3_9BACT|nr:LemA family protein [Adhaeribacter radiodurans]QMU26791.1 LemA family protein [Adhaeribacter radiodurans]